MKKHLRRVMYLCALLLFPWMGRAQDTLYATPWQMADTVYGQLEQHVNTGLLMNRLMVDTSQALVHNTHKLNAYTPRADHFYRLMYELKLMALDSSQIIDQYALYMSASTYMGSMEFAENRNVFPIGIADYQYNWLDENYAIQNGLLSLNGYSITDTDPNNGSAYQTKRTTLIAPLFDYFVSDDIHLIFREADFRSNYRSVNEISGIEIFRHGEWTSLAFGEEFNLAVDFSATQEFTIRVTYADGSEISNPCVINTPELENAVPKAQFLHCKRIEKIWNGAAALEYCLIPSCVNPTQFNGGEAVKPYKPYILVSGYRPPILAQSFETTWRNYHEEHAQLLGQLLDKGYDIYLVRFNIHENPQGHGMQESAALFRKFLEQVNSEKLDGMNETVIQGSSMGCDIVRLALLQMEKEHFANNSYPHHHSRLFINYDGNTWGANIPLAYQYQIYSGIYLQETAAVGQIENALFSLLKVYLYAIMQQKTVKELLMYHAAANLQTSFTSPLSVNELEPTHHPLRQDFYDALAAVDNGNNFTPMPNSTRNIAISLGKIAGTNDLNPVNDAFNSAGEYWRNDAIPGIQRLRTAIYTDDYTTFFHREKVLTTWLFSTVPVISGTVKHVVDVKHMQEIDNASGSYLEGVGNLIGVGNIAYFGPSSEGLASHKSVITAFGIHPSYWPNAGSLTLNMQDLGLMYPSFEDLGLDVKSFQFGYPNLGRPNDHFSITPFEAVYVDEQIDPHVRMFNSVYLAELNAFVFNEVEPWFLGLQNEEVGTQARSNFLYQRRLQALHEITVGHTVSPRTDPGDYTVHPNVHLQLHAGDSIDVFPGTTFMEGCKADLLLEFEFCGGGGKQYSSTNPPRMQHATFDPKVPVLEQTLTQVSELRIFPNPSNGQSTLISLSGASIWAIEISDLSGNLLWNERGIDRARIALPTGLPKGSYLVKVLCGKEVETLKWIVV